MRPHPALASASEAAGPREGLSSGYQSNRQCHCRVEHRQNLAVHTDPQQGMTKVVRAADPWRAPLPQSANYDEHGIQQRNRNPSERRSKTRLRGMKHDCRAKQEAAAITHKDACGWIVEVKQTDAGTRPGHSNVTASAQEGGCDRAGSKAIGMVEHVNGIAGNPDHDRDPPNTSNDPSKYRRASQCRCLGPGGKRSDVIECAYKTEQSQQDDMGSSEAMGTSPSERQAPPVAESRPMCASGRS